MTATATHTLIVPGRIAEDYLDPEATGMPDELGLPAPAIRRRGRGTQWVYADVSALVAKDTADYMLDRAFLMLRQSGTDEEAKRTHREAVKVADAILAAL